MELHLLTVMIPQRIEARWQQTGLQAVANPKATRLWRKRPDVPNPLVAAASV